jgi:hypothetical protein
LEHLFKGGTIDKGLITRLEAGEAKAGVLEGRQWQPRDIAKAMYDAGWVNLLNLTRGVATCLGESQGFDKAENDNFNSDGELTSRDVGAMQINISAAAVGSDYEAQLHDFNFNIHEARRLWLQWRQPGDNDVQAWNHWVAFKSGIVTDPLAKGKYIQKATRGVGNFVADYLFHIPEPPLLWYKDGAKYPL